MKKSVLLSIPAFLLTLAFIFSGCDEVEPPYKKNVNFNTKDTSRTVLLEEFTGHKCVNCPEAAKDIEDLKDIYGNNLVVVAIHAGFFAQPESPPFDYDFTTQAGNTIESTFNNASYPRGMISRMQTQGSRILEPDEYSFYVDSLANSKPLAMLDLSTGYNSSNRQVDIEVSGIILDPLDGDYNISVFVTEDSIIKPQKNNNPNIGPTPKIMDYVHMHVLRGAVNGEWGENYFSGPKDSLDALPVKNYSYTLDNEWKAKDSHIVAFIYRSDNAGGNEYEVIQAKKASVK